MIKGVQLFAGRKSYKDATDPQYVISQADFISMLFTMYKNIVRG